jgi:predicted dehydrogenase
VCGDEGYIEIPVPWKPPATSTFVITRGTPPRMDKGPAPAGAPPRDVRTVKVEADVYGIEADDFAASVLDGKPPRVSASDTIGNMRAIEQLRRQVKA